MTTPDSTLLSCPLCGSQFAESAQTACSSCPLHSGCSLVCCPVCGYSTVSAEQSRWARWALRLTRLLRQPAAPETTEGRQTLAELPVNVEARVVELGALPADLRDRLQAYGVDPGQTLRLLQRHPVTIIQVEQAEIAFEPQIARSVVVEQLA